MGGPLWLHPDDDIAPNRPGEHLYARAERGRWGGVARLLGRPSPARDAACELRAAEVVGGELDALAGAGWRVLHAIPLPGGLRIGHLLIGPGGVFAVRATWCRGRDVVVEHDDVRGGVGPLPVVRHCGRAATLAAHALCRATATEVPVRAVLVPVGALSVRVRPEVGDTLHVRRERELAAFARLGGELAPAAVERLYEAARDRRAWNAL